MYQHIQLGETAEERKRKVSNLIRSGAITLGGYKKDKIYGLLSCSSGKRTKIESHVFFKDMQEAIDNRYRPCGHCLPEEYKLWKAAKNSIGGRPKNKNILPKDGEAYFYPAFFTAAECNRLWNNLRQNITWKQEPVIIMGKEIMQPRLTAWYGDEGKSYSYTGITLHPLAWTEDLLFIKSRIEVSSGQIYNSALLNFYRNGNDSVGWHRDNEKSLGINPVIGSVSFGTPRIFHFRHYKDKKLKEEIVLTNGSFLLMTGNTQHNWLHSIQKEPSVKTGRINITFRTIVN